MVARDGHSSSDQASPIPSLSFLEAYGSPTLTSRWASLHSAAEVLTQKLGVA